MQNCSGVILKNLRWCSENCIFFQSNFSEEQIPSKKLWFLNFFRNFGSNVCCGNKNMHCNFPGYHFWGKMLTWKSSNFSSFWHWATTFRSDSNIFTPRKRRFHSTYAEDLFWVTHFQKMCNQHSFVGSFSKNCQTSFESFPAEMLKLHSTIPEEQCVYTSSEKKSAPYFSGFWVNNSAVSPKVFQQLCENCIFCVQRNIFDENLFL